MFRVISRIAGMKTNAGKSGATPLGRNEQSKVHATRAGFYQPVARPKCRLEKPRQKHSLAGEDHGD
jgi:hypothetical protein